MSKNLHHIMLIAEPQTLVGAIYELCGPLFIHQQSTMILIILIFFNLLICSLVKPLKCNVNNNLDY